MARQRSVQLGDRSMKSALDGITGANADVFDPNSLAVGGQAPVLFVVRATGTCERIPPQECMHRARPPSHQSLETVEDGVDLCSTIGINTLIGLVAVLAG
jgi:hypothetical protein